MIYGYFMGSMMWYKTDTNPMCYIRTRSVLVNLLEWDLWSIIKKNRNLKNLTRTRLVVPNNMCSLEYNHFYFRLFSIDPNSNSMENRESMANNFLPLLMHRQIRFGEDEISEPWNMGLNFTNICFVSDQTKYGMCPIMNYPSS